MANIITLQLPGGIQILNPTPVDPRFRVSDITQGDILTDPTLYIGFYPILDENTGNIFIVSGGDATNGWVFKKAGGSAEMAIAVPLENWEGPVFEVDLAEGKQYTLQVKDLVTEIGFKIKYPDDAKDVSREVIVRIDNSNNTSPISTITWDGNWVWAIGDPVTGIAAGKVVELVVRNISQDTVKAYTDTEN